MSSSSAASSSESFPAVLESAPLLYLVSKVFTSGYLSGIGFRQISSVRYDVGGKFGGGVSGPQYLVQACVPVTHARARELFRENGSLLLPPQG